MRPTPSLLAAAAGLFLTGLAPLLAPGVGVGLERPWPGSASPAALLVVVVAAQAAPLLLARRAPLTAVAAGAVALAVSFATGLPPTAADVALPVAVFLAAGSGGARRAAAAGGLAVAPVAVLVAAAPDRAAGPALTYAVVVVAVPVAAALLTRPRPAAAPPAPAAPHTPARPPVPAPAVLAELTAREREVLACLARGRSNAEIGDDLGIGVETVKTHVSRVVRKLRVRDRTAAALLGHRCGVR